ncbi:MAG: two-component regulator propeller domain-containing protein [Fimbriimonadaceae bacterium]
MPLLLCFLTIATQKPATNAQPSRVKGEVVSKMSDSLWIVFQAKNNHRWFGSDGDGVYRYDGKTITHFTTKHGLPNDRIREIQEDKSGNIYVGTLEGISKFNGRTFTTLKPMPSTEWKLVPDDLWFKGNSMVNGPYRYDGKKLHHLKFPKHYLEDDRLSSNPPSSPYGVYTIYKDRRGSLWFGTADLGVGRYDGKSISWLYEDHLTNTPAGGSFGIRSIIEDNKGKFWFCNTRYRYNISTNSEAGKDLISYTRDKGIADLKFSDGSDSFYYQSILEHKGELWMATYRGGVWRYDGKKAIRYPVKDGSAEVTVFAISKDRQGVLWLGTHQAGAYRFNGKSFEKFRP